MLKLKPLVNPANTGSAKFRISEINDKLNPLYMDEANPLTVKVTMSQVILLLMMLLILMALLSQILLLILL